MRSKPLPDLDFLREHLQYTPETGSLLWRKCPKGLRVNPGDPAGRLCAAHNRLRIRFRNGGTRYSVPRVIWKLVTGQDPGELDIDHIDRNTLNSRWKNFRLATKALNQQNKVADSDSLSGLRGVWQLKHGAWAAQIVRDKVRVTLGWRFRTKEEAYAAYQEAASAYAAGTWPPKLRPGP